MPYNSLYHNELYCCDWDMFWTMHKDARKHSLLRAISGGPVYVSDRPGATDPEILKPLIYRNGEILLMDRSAKPTEDCAFFDPMKDGVLKLHNVSSCGDKKAGGLAVYNLTDREQSFSFRPVDIPDLEQSETYWLYDYFRRKAFLLKQNEKYEGVLAEDGYGWFLVLPCGMHGACPGLLDKYVGFMAVENIYESDNSVTAILRESGTVGWISEKKPEKVLINNVDYTAKLKARDNVYEVDLPETSKAIVITLCW